MSEEQNYHIYLCLKEAINNAVKYSRATSLEVCIKEVPAGLEFSVTDNGIGLDITSIQKGNGLDNMKNRAENIKAAYSFESEPGKGVSVRVILNIPH